jgi:hypothetical protein
MNGELGTYTFLPWLRQGIANKVQSADGDASVKTRASITVNLSLKGEGGESGDVVEAVPKEVALYGPGDIVGIESSAIIRSEPLNWITNFEPNYLPFIEFYDEDFPYRYTPAVASGGRLRPWITLIVLTEEEFKDGGNILGKPLPFIEITASPLEDVFPVAEEMWAWAHVHVNKNIAGSGAAPQAPDLSNVLAQFKTLIAQQPDMAYSRLMCPRKLAPNTRYHAFLIPTFETGRLAGLGLDPATAPHATFSAWGAGRDVPTLMPLYHRWFFRTGSRGDFEFLVRLLEPRPADERVGRRDIDVQRPGSNISGITDPQLEGVLKLGGALLAPLSDAAEQVLATWEDWDEPYPHDFQLDLSQFLNLAQDYEDAAAATANQATQLDPLIRNDPDPLITPPIYGRWHALTDRVLRDSDGNDLPHNRNWLHELNLDPRWRSGAGFGTDVVIANQEEYMDAAWDQVGSVLEANRQIRLGQLAKMTSTVWYEKHLKPLQRLGNAKILLMAAPVQKRVINQGVTVYHQAKHSPVTRAVTSAPLRRMLRPSGRLHRYAGLSADINATTLVDRVNAGVVTAAPPNTVPPDLQTVEDVAEELQPGTVPDVVLDALRDFPWLRFVPLALAVLVLLLLLLFGAGVVLWTIGVAAIGGLVFLWRRLSELIAAMNDADSVAGENQTPESVDTLPNSADFVLTPSIDFATLDPSAPPAPATPGPSDSVQATRFKAALKDAYTTVQTGRVAGIKPELVPLDVSAVATATLATLNPAATIPRYVLGKIEIPLHIIDLIGEQFVEAMAYPEFDIPMYKPLADKSTELFVPNLNFIEQNTITLLNTNQRFIESFMVGLNHEFARELLWREYPTDQRGSYFRQFWDVSSFLSDTADAEARREELKDIPPLHEWPRASNLGDHDHREQGLDNEEELVLVIRGELLKKYPNAVIYAHKAKWQPKSETDPTPDKSKERVFDDTVPIKSPLYEAKVKPDIYFFGFDLVEDEARGDDTVDNEPGWFFVIKERPGEPRFGLDIDREGPIQVWNDLAWPDVVPGVADGDFINIAGAPNRTLPGTAPAGDDQEKKPQWEEDHLLSWTSHITSAELAYIMFQAPVLMGVHASEMLPE